ncbi:hypothetical protein GALL_401750 [mine drainage metagenome]|uniref:Uncharacterized protein n=1 Tax=mine drainage metagenome TaxID=410659 RepID=A0A1J5Q4B4_9ZZZZ
MAEIGVNLSYEFNHLIADQHGFLPLNDLVGEDGGAMCVGEFLNDYKARVATMPRNLGCELPPSNQGVQRYFRTISDVPPRACA